MADDLDVAKFNGGQSGNSAATSGGEMAGNSAQIPATLADLEAAKQEILKEMRKEMTKMKQDVIEGDFGKISAIHKLLELPVIYLKSLINEAYKIIV